MTKIGPRKTKDQSGISYELDCGNRSPVLNSTNYGISAKDVLHFDFVTLCSNLQYIVLLPHTKYALKIIHFKKRNLLFSKLNYQAKPISLYLEVIMPHYPMVVKDYS